MEPNLLQQFRQQLATWIERQMATQRLPFQRLEICPRLLTERGRLAPDIVLWINRDSQLAGSMIIIPHAIDDQLLAESVAMAQALGLGNFTTWAPREVTIWRITDGTPAPQHSFTLPPVNQIVPDDFRNTLSALLEKLKIISVTSALSATEFSLHYFANLCLRNLQELAPGLTVSARITAGQTAADEWLELAPAEKAWLSLWRVLFLIWKRHLPPGLQPERLEQVMRYALAEFIRDSASLACLEIRKGEPALQDQEAVRLHHLATRMRQLGWPRSKQRAVDLVDLLLFEASYRYGLTTPNLPWQTDDTSLWVNCVPLRTSSDCTLVIPRPYRGGLAVQASLTESSHQPACEEDLFSLFSANKFASAVAVFNSTKVLSREERESRLIRLRQAWPNRRFELPNQSPAWLWEVLFLSGQVSEQLSLVLPRDWHRALGVETLWPLLCEHYQLCELASCTPDRQALRLSRTERDKPRVRVHLADSNFEISSTAVSRQPGTMQIWLKAPHAMRDFLSDRAFTAAGSQWPAWTETIVWGTALFLRTRLGRFLWDLCSDRAKLPPPEITVAGVTKYGMLLPDENCLRALSLSGSLRTGEIPETNTLEREFTSIFGPVPEIPQPLAEVVSGQAKSRHTIKANTEQIIRDVFVDGVPLFPEHYLMNTYRPELVRFDLCGPLEISEVFFDHISLSAPGSDRKLEVSGKILAEALVLLSHSRRTEVDLPKEEKLLAELLERYRLDLERLWDRLVKECRRAEPHRRSAVRLAQKIWRQQGLPPDGTW